MKIGLVLSKTPAYSETFFLSKINGLKVSGFDITLFVQKKENDFSLCEVIVSPRVDNGNKLAQFFRVLYVSLGLLIKNPRSLFKFVSLELKANRSWIQIVKNMYNNAHILKADLDWLHFGFATMAIQSEHVAQAIGAKMAVSFRGFDLDVYPIKHPDCYPLLFKNVDKVHAISKYMLDKGYELGLSKDKLYKIITPAIDVLKFKRKEQVRSPKLQILTIARLHWIKGLEYCIRAMKLVKDQGIDFTYSIVGEGIEYDRLQNLIQSLELSKHVVLEGRKDHDDVLDYLSRADIYIQYSESEGFCNAVLEAQAMGLLCITSDGGALPENVIDQRTGWIVPKKNPEKLSEKILEVLALSEIEKNNIRIQAQKRVLIDFNLEKQQKEFADFYNIYLYDV